MSPGASIQPAAAVIHEISFLVYLWWVLFLMMKLKMFIALIWQDLYILMATTSGQEISSNIKRWPGTWSYRLFFSAFLHLCLFWDSCPSTSLYLAVHSNITNLRIGITSGPQEGKHPCGCVVFFHSQVEDNMLRNNASKLSSLMHLSYSETNFDNSIFYLRVTIMHYLGTCFC